MRQFVFSIFIFLSWIPSYSQLFGGAITGNIQTEGIGVELRGILPYRYIQIAPQISYYPFFNKVSEVYAGISLHGMAINNSRFQLYGIINGSYDYWANYEESPSKKAKPHNITADVGIGIAGQQCISPFAEFRYNPIFREANARIGILLDLTCGGGAGYHSGQQGAVKCTPCR